MGFVIRLRYVIQLWSLIWQCWYGNADMAMLFLKDVLFPTVLYEVCALCCSRALCYNLTLCYYCASCWNCALGYSCALCYCCVLCYFYGLGYCCANAVLCATAMLNMCYRCPNTKHYYAKSELTLSYQTITLNLSCRCPTKPLRDYYITNIAHGQMSWVWHPCFPNGKRM